MATIPPIGEPIPAKGQSREAALMIEFSKLADALAYYADPANWAGVQDDPMSPDAPIDFGERARAALGGSKCGVVGDPPIGDHVGPLTCELLAGHDGYHRSGRITWLGYAVPKADLAADTIPANPTALQLAVDLLGNRANATRRYLDARIKWHSGSGELSSRADLVTDSKIVEELKDVRDVLNGGDPSRCEGNRLHELPDSCHRCGGRRVTQENLTKPYVTCAECNGTGRRRVKP